MVGSQPSKLEKLSMSFEQLSPSLYCLSLDKTSDLMPDFIIEVSTSQTPIQ
jgi:hypothetical protein